MVSDYVRMSVCHANNVNDTKFSCAAVCQALSSLGRGRLDPIFSFTTPLLEKSLKVVERRSMTILSVGCIRS